MQTATLDQDLIKKDIAIHTEQFSKSLRDLEISKSVMAPDILSGKIDPLAYVKKSKEIETVLVDHDSTGAKQESLLGEQLGIELDIRGLDLDEYGHLIANENDSDQYLCMVTLVDLDRLNTEGGHTTGNTALALTVEGIEKIITKAIRENPSAAPLREKPLESLYNIYHTRGSDFTFTLNLSGAPFSDTIADDIMTALSSFKSKPDMQYDASPLGISSLTRAEAIAMFNTMQDKLSERKLPKISDENDIKRALITFWNKSNQLRLEEEMIFTKGESLINKIVAGEDPEAIQSHFNLYVEKFFNGTPMETLSSFLMEGSTVEERKEHMFPVRKNVRAALRKKITNDMAGERVMMKAEDQIVLDILAKQDLPIIKDESSEEDRLKKEALPRVESAILSARRAGTKSGELIRDFSKTISASLDIISRIGTENITSNDIDTLNKLIDFSRVQESIMIGEEEIYVLAPVREAIGHIQSGNVTSEDTAKITLLIEVSQQEFKTRLRRIDPVTGLPNRTEYQLQMKELHERIGELEPGQSVRTLFIDLGFLKYFNVGGRELGNTAIQSTAEVLEQALEKAGIDGTAFRYAGDEFTCLFVGTTNRHDGRFERRERCHPKNGAVKYPVSAREIDD
jgi:GGDEF domain-containing protein